MFHHPSPTTCRTKATTSTRKQNHLVRRFTVHTLQPRKTGSNITTTQEPFKCPLHKRRKQLSLPLHIILQQRKPTLYQESSLLHDFELLLSVSRQSQLWLLRYFTIPETTNMTDPRYLTSLVHARHRWRVPLQSFDYRRPYGRNGFG